MKKLLILLIVFYSLDAFSFGTNPPNSIAYCATPTAVCSLSNKNCGSYDTQAKALRYIRPGLLHDNWGYMCGKDLTCPTGYSLSKGECSPPPCPDNARRTAENNYQCPVKPTCNVGETLVFENNQYSCISSSSSSSASSAPATCDNGLTKDENGFCSGCPSGMVKDFTKDPALCETKNNCSYPELYSTLTNKCYSNPNNCALGAQADLINGGCMALRETSCPSGFVFSDSSHLTCSPSQSSSAASSASGSDSSSDTSSTPTSSAASSASSLPLIPVNENDNTDPSQDTSLSASIPPDMTKNQCLQKTGTLQCTAIENCKLTFGVHNCVGMTSEQNCPNSYVVNGQKICVLNTSGSASSSGSGAASSSGAGSGSNGEGEGAGDCDPTASDYLQCIMPESDDLPPHTVTGSGFDSVEEINADFKRRVAASDSVVALNKIKTVVSLSSPQCPVFGFDILGHYVSTTIHCSLWATIGVLLSPIMIAIWSIIAFRIFASA